MLVILPPPDVDPDLQKLYTELHTKRFIIGCINQCENARFADRQIAVDFVNLDKALGAIETYFEVENEGE